MSERVASAEFIFVGMGQRIYFVDHQYQEVPSYEKAATRYGMRAAIVEIRVLKALFPKQWTDGDVVRIPVSTSMEASSNGRSPYEDLIRRYHGKRGIYFTRRTTIYDEFSLDAQGTSKRLPMPMRAHVLDTLPAAAGPKGNPLEMRYLDEVMVSIDKRSSRENK